MNIKPANKLSLIFLCSLFFHYQLLAQSLTSANSLADAQIKNAIDLYNVYTGANALIYNGGNYLPYNFPSVGNPFFETDSVSEADITYGGREYRKVPLLYDLVRQEVVLLNYNHQSYIVLHNDQIDSFRIFSHTFIHLFHEDTSNTHPGSGFYDLLYNGSIKILAWRTKDFQGNISGNEMVRTFYQHNHYYVFKNNSYYPVDDKKVVLSLFKDKQHLIRRYARRHKLKFRKKFFEPTLVAVTAYYDQLTNK